MRKRLYLLLSLSLLMSFVFSAGDTSAQYYRKYRRSDVDRTIKRAEVTSDQFVKVFDRSLDRSALNDSEREDKLNEKARDLENKLDHLRKDFDRRQNWWESRDTAAEALQYAKGINNSVRSRRYSQECERMWARLRTDLNEIARYYGLQKLQR